MYARYVPYVYDKDYTYIHVRTIFHFHFHSSFSFYKERRRGRRGKKKVKIVGNLIKYLLFLREKEGARKKERERERDSPLTTSLSKLGKHSIDQASHLKHPIHSKLHLKLKTSRERSLA